MQLLHVLLLAAPALAVSPLVQQLQQLAQASTEVKGLFKNADAAHLDQNIPKAIDTWKGAILAPKQSDIDNFPGSVEKDDQGAVCEEFVNFATKAQDLINAVTEKHSLITATPYKNPLAVILRNDDGYTQTLSENIKDVTPECGKTIEGPSEKLLDAYQDAANTYTL